MSHGWGSGALVGMHEALLGVSFTHGHPAAGRGRHGAGRHPAQRRALLGQRAAADGGRAGVGGLAAPGGARTVALAFTLPATDKQDINRALLASGATITEMNCVRKHLSAIKGGRLAAAAAPARVVTLAISDVPGDDPAVIASGPTVPDPTTSPKPGR